MATLADPGAAPTRRRVRLKEAGSVLRQNRWEIAGYGAITVGLAVLLWWQVRRVNGFYLDEWVYVSGAQHIWDHLPGGLVGTIPLWDRGVQRAYSTMLAPIVGLFGRSTAFTLGHGLNVLLLSVASVPAAALMARRVIASSALRVLAVGLAVVIPWSMIGAHLLTESLSYPVFLWASLAIVRSAEEPRIGRQAVALVAVVGLGLCRLDLGVIAGTLVLASLGGELLRPSEDRPIRDVLRRQAPILVLLVIGLVGVVYLLGPGSSHLGRYGTLDLGGVRSRLFGAQSGLARNTAELYTRSLILGTVLLPFTLGLGTALAGVAGRLGRSVGVLSIVALSNLVLIVGAVTLSTSGGAPEERYVFYAVALLALLAVAGIERARALLPWIVAAGVVVVWIVRSGGGFPALNSGNFFAAPAGAFWTRVMDYRLRTLEHDLLGWTGLNPQLWHAIAIAVAILVAVVALARWRSPLARALLIAGAVTCLAGQAVILTYSLRQELYGTVDVAGGISSGPRETFVDATLPSGTNVAVAPAALTNGQPFGGTERVEFWNKRIDATVALGWDGSPVPAPPGFGVLQSAVGPDGVAVLSGQVPRFLTAQVDDPRVQFATQLMRHSPDSDYGLFSGTRRRALWTAVGLQPDGSMLAHTPLRLTVDRGDGVRAVRLTLQAPAGQPGSAPWRISAGGHTVASGRLTNGATQKVLLRVPGCGQAACKPWSWRMSDSGRAVPVALPVFGAPAPPRPVVLWVPAVRLLR
jgi:hypothetical protein